MKVSPWFEDCFPVRNGVYECEVFGLKRWAKWFGTSWGFYCLSWKEASRSKLRLDEHGRLRGDQSKRWRGLLA